MATLVVANSSTGTMGNKAYKRGRYEKAETAYGYIPAAAYNINDILTFNIPAKELIFAKFLFNGVSNDITSTGTSAEALEIFSGATVTNGVLAVTWNVGAAATAQPISYKIEYIRGTGRSHPGLAVAAGEVAGESGIQIKITVNQAN